MKLKDIPTSLLEKELERRREEERREEERKRRKIQWEEFLRRPECQVIGRAYGYPGGEYARDYTLATVSIKGNMGTTYEVKMKVAPTVETYLHNSLTEEDIQEFTQKLNSLVEEFIKEKCSDPAVVTTLICLSKPYNHKEAIEEWHKEAINRLCQFSLEELEAGKEELERNWDTAHGQIDLINEAMKAKRDELSKV
ncbi:MAG: hypothetical protein JRC60_08610 [Deltaproteobacteria bacterium]|nr:hypothetical protein [Deltaproteobacteria bacterium]